MKGVVFNLLEEMVEQEFGLEVWESLLETTGQDGVFVSTETYTDEQLVSLVVAAHEKSGIPVNDLIRSFGKFMFPRFHQTNPGFFKPGMTLKEFLLSVDQVIHVEVRKLHPGAGLPQFEYVDESDSELTMIYSSPRKMCMLAEGLVSGAAEHFQTEYTIDHSECMHDGADACRLHLKFSV